MISLIVPAKGQIAKSSKLLTEELGTAACIKSHVNKLSVIDAIKSCKQKLSLYKQGLYTTFKSVMHDSRNFLFRFQAASKSLILILFPAKISRLPIPWDLFFPQYTDILSVPAFTDTNKQYAWSKSRYWYAIQDGIH